MRKRKHPDSKLTLRECFEKHYDVSELAQSTIRLFGYALNRWERSGCNIPVGKVDNRTAIKFRDALRADNLKPITTNSYWQHLRCIFRLLAPPHDKNPQGLSIIERIPYLKPLRVVLGLPRRVTQEELSLFYLSCNVAQFPRTTAYPPAELWRTLALVAYFTGLRKSDLFGIRLDDIDVEKSTLHFVARKTSKPAIFPLHPAAVEHIKRIWSPRPFLFPSMSKNGGSYSYRWREIITHSGVEHFTLQDLRRTGASEAERARAGMGEVFLQHAPMTHTERNYLNRSEELKETVLAFRVPLAFKHGPKQVDREFERARLRREKLMKEAVFHPPNRPKPSEWRFKKLADSAQLFRQYWFRGKWRSIGLTQGAVLKCLALSAEPVGLNDLATVVYGKRKRPKKQYAVSGRVCGVISKLRQTLRNEFDLHPLWNPVPCTKRGTGGKWTLLLPAEPKSGKRGVA